MSAEERLKKYLEYSKNNVEINEYLMSYQIMKDIEELLNQNQQFKEENKELKDWKELRSGLLLSKENIRINEENQKLKILVESIKLDVTLNEEQENLLDSILFKGDDDE